LWLFAVLVLCVPPCFASAFGTARLLVHAAPQQDDVEALLLKLRQSPDAATAGIHAADLLRLGGEKGRIGLLAIFSDPVVPPQVIEGALSSLRVQNDAADDVLSAIQSALSLRRDADAAIRKFLGSFGDRSPILSRVLSRLSGTDGDPLIEPIRRMAVFLIDSEAERMLAIEQFVICLERSQGVTRLRGAAVPVVDAGSLLQRRAVNPQRFVRLVQGDRQLALAVSTVEGVESLPPTQAPIPTLLTPELGWIDSLGSRDEQLLVMLSGMRLLREHGREHQP
jgi:hypothetical protein